MKRCLTRLLVTPLIVLFTLQLSLVDNYPLRPLLIGHASRELNVNRVVFIGNDNLTLAVVPRINYTLFERVRIEHYLDFKDTSPGNLSDAYLVVFSGGWLTRVIEDNITREEFLVFLRELHKSRGGKGGYIAFGNHTSVLFDALCLAGVRDGINCEKGINPFQDNPVVAVIILELDGGVITGSVSSPLGEYGADTPLEEILAETLSMVILGEILRVTAPRPTIITLTPSLPFLDISSLKPILLPIIILAVAIAVAISVVIVIIVLAVVK